MRVEFLKVKEGLSDKESDELLEVKLDSNYKLIQNAYKDLCFNQVIKNKR